MTLGAGLTRRVAAVLGVVLVALGIGHVVYMVGADRLGQLSVLSLVTDTSIGTWVASVLLLACALLAAGAALLARRDGSRWARNWWLLAAVFALMSVDEVAAVHERFSTPVRGALGVDADFLYYAWVVPALLFVAVFALVQVRFLLALDAATRRGLVLAGIVFVAGAAGLEMIEAVLETRGLQDSVRYDLLVLGEELMETGAVMGAACVLLAYLLRRLGRPVLTLTPGAADA